MTDNEYAVRIYREVFHVETDDGDAYIRGILDAVKTLDEREQIALENYYRYKKTFEQTGADLGVGASRANQIVSKALRKLRHPSRLRNMSVQKIIEHKNRRLEEAETEAAVLREQIKRLLRGESVDPKTTDALGINNESIYEIDFSSRIHNSLVRSGISTVEDLLAIDDFDELWKIRGLGKISQNQIINKMREQGYTEWADRMERGKSF